MADKNIIIGPRDIKDSFSSEIQLPMVRFLDTLQFIDEVVIGIVQHHDKARQPMKFIRAIRKVHIFAIPSDIIAPTEMENCLGAFVTRYDSVDGEKRPFERRSIFEIMRMSCQKDVTSDFSSIVLPIADDVLLRDVRDEGSIGNEKILSFASRKSSVVIEEGVVDESVLVGKLSISMTYLQQTSSADLLSSFFRHDVVIDRVFDIVEDFFFDGLDALRTKRSATGEEDK